MRLYKNDNVLIEGQKRIKYLFNEFDNIIVSYSGGKDSSVIFDLAYKEAQSRGKSIDVLFLDQEAEFNETIEMARYIKSLPGVNFIWLQIPFKLFNASSHLGDEWLECWKEGTKWIREKEADSIKENVFGTDRFKDMFSKVISYYYKDKKACYLAGVRAEESPSRLLATTRALTYKDKTWGVVLSNKKLYYTFYPLYDWTYKDIWKYIFENNVKYNKIYDYQYMYGTPVANMRVSSLNHETSLKHIKFLKEFDVDLYNKLCERLEGISTYNKLEEYIPSNLPFMFTSWEEYRDYLVENLIQNPKHREKFYKWFKTLDRRREGVISKSLDKLIIGGELTAIIRNDYHSTTLSNLLVNVGKVKRQIERRKNLINNQNKDGRIDK